jgi:glycosyltransferase involved in cell wall biosynthesis
VRCPSLSELPAPPPGKSGWPWTEESPQLPETMPDGRPWPRVSVVTPSYNQAEFIEQTIRSVLLQGYPDLEYIIIDGGSTDGSLEIIGKYEPWLAYWVSEPDRGQTDAINKGWARATGEVLAYINSDDYYLERAVAAAVEGFRTNPRAGMVYGTAIVVDETGKELRVWEARPFDLKVMLTEGSIVPQPATFFSRNALKRVGYLDEQWHMIMDYELCIRIGMRFPAVFVPGVLARFRDHSHSKTRTRFEATATELIHFVASFSPEQVSAQDLRVIKRATASRVYYEWSLAYVALGRQYALKAVRQLLKSILRYPLFALRRPVQTAYLVKELLLGHLEIIGVKAMDVVKRTS